MGLFADKYPDVSYEEKLRLWDEVKADARFPDYLYGCYECGICVSACPSARFYDFSPRKIAQAAAREDIELIYEQMNDDVWNCSQCFSCNRCPRQNSPGGVITILREVAVNNGLKSAAQALEGYSRIVYKIMGTGTQVSPDMLQPDAFPDWGPQVKQVSDELDLWRRALPPETLHTTKASWQVDERTLIELYLIWYNTGVMDMIANVDEGLNLILSDVMEEMLEEAGYEI
ncbi:MAG: 4Fe-4S dicluster domain-containing protein [Anaerolineales bacterium]|jgi:heterodisulfide reductase subunit C|nr:4Fe-4S dicluster domain-containing protein [Anaerolineales bacterium]MDP7644333.1 4Fe-4S dicluster domain-containing protein [Anaerolineales bacterium]|tara:strand:- start:53 stop:742 length:690 start_codon:yes stop_codon:yes gene_type:complete